MVFPRQSSIGTCQNLEDLLHSRVNSISVEGYVHGDEYVLLDYLKHWLPMNHSDHPELLEIAFEAISPGRKQHQQ